MLWRSNLPLQNTITSEKPCRVHFATWLEPFSALVATISLTDCFPFAYVNKMYIPMLQNLALRLNI